MGFATINGEWVQDLLPGKPGDVGVTARDNRRFVEAVPKAKSQVDKPVRARHRKEDQVYNPPAHA
jgi:hypothetical protein